jgi:hypothetical protein
MLLITFAFGSIFGILFQKYHGAGVLLKRAGVAWFRKPAVRPTLSIPVGTGIPSEFQGKLSLFILAGQSNMSGRGELPASQTVHPRVFMFGNDYRWKPALEPVDSAEEQVDKVSEDAVSDPAGFGPGLSFALRVAEKRPDPVIGLIPCAKGNTTISEWQRSLSDSTLYGSCLKRVRAASPAGKVAGFLFFQGESDALDLNQYPDRVLSPADYATKFSDLVRDLRNDLYSPSLPVVFAQIGSNNAPEAYTNWEVVRGQQRAIQLPCCAMIRTDDLPLRDSEHFTTASYRAIGQRFAAAYLDLIRNQQCL